MKTTQFDSFAAPLIGMQVSHVWRGYGSALFLEFGGLTDNGVRDDGTARNPSGEMGLMIEWSWRIERARSIACGSWSNERRWAGAFQRLIGQTVTGAELFGRLPEISIALSGGSYVASMMTAEGQPEWVLFDRRGGTVRWLSVRNAAVVLTTDRQEGG